MNRADVIQRLIDNTQARNYLEIGVCDGSTFLGIKARRKIAVDPHFLISWLTRLKWMLKNPSNIAARYWETTSDDYFAQRKPARTRDLDVVFVDGLHTYPQALKDVFNALDHLREDGIIVMHDCNPSHEAAAYPAESHDHAASLNLPGWTEEWCGDVWKAVCYLRAFRKNLNVFVLDCDYGLGIVSRGEPENVLDLTYGEMDKLTYKDLAANRKELLNLKDTDFLNRYLKAGQYRGNTGTERT